MSETTNDPCELCNRTTQKLTEHHLIPRTLHGNKKAEREFGKEEMKTRLAMLCRPCHSQIHDIFTEKELGWTYNTVEKLKAHPEVVKWIEWVSKRPHWRG
jgi:5-methylcytosine-specific restriction endonuclease McrA